MESSTNSSYHNVGAQSKAHFGHSLTGKMNAYGLDEQANFNEQEQIDANSAYNILRHLCGGSETQIITSEGFDEDSRVCKRTQNARFEQISLIPTDQDKIIEGLLGRIKEVEGVNIRALQQNELPTVNSKEQRLLKVLPEFSSLPRAIELKNERLLLSTIGDFCRAPDDFSSLNVLVAEPGDPSAPLPRRFTHPPFVNFGEVLGREIELGFTPRSSPFYITTFLLSFYSEEVESLSRHKLLLAYRWASRIISPDVATTFRGVYGRAQAVLYKRVVDSRRAQQRLRAASAAHAHTTMATTKVLKNSDSTTAQIDAVGIEVDDIKTYLHYAFRAEETTRVVRRFLERARLVSLERRFSLASKIGDFMIPCSMPSEFGTTATYVNESFVSERGSGPFTVGKSVPLLGPKDLSSIFETLNTLFGLSVPSSSSQVDEYRYKLKSLFNGIMSSQTKAFVFTKFSPISVKENTCGSADHARLEPCHLRQSECIKKLLKGFFPRLPPPWEIQQITEINTVIATARGLVPVSSTIHINSLVLTSCCPEIQAEFGLIDEGDVTVVLAHIKKQASSIVSRKVDLDSSDQVERSESGVSEEELMQLEVILQLRFARTRGYRLEILKILNYFASVLRELFLHCETADLFGVRVRGLHYAEEEELSTTINSCTLRAQRESLEGKCDIDRELASFVEISQSPHVDNGVAADSFVFNDYYDDFDFITGAQRSNVRDGRSGLLVMDEWALQELHRIEQRMLRTAIYYLIKHKERVALKVELRQRVSGSKEGKMEEQAQDHDEGDSWTPVDDITLIIEDLYESEYLFSRYKLSFLNNLREAYAHTVQREAASALAAQIVSLITLPPRLDLSDMYFMYSYVQNIVCLNLVHTLMQEILFHLASTEMSLEKIYDPIIGAAEELNRKLFPGANKLSVLSMCTSFHLLSYIVPLVTASCEDFFTRFNILRTHGSELVLRRAILEELLSQWRLLVLSPLSKAPMCAFGMDRFCSLEKICEFMTQQGKDDVSDIRVSTAAARVLDASASLAANSTRTDREVKTIAMWCQVFDLVIVRMALDSTHNCTQLWRHIHTAQVEFCRKFCLEECATTEHTLSELVDAYEKVDAEILHESRVASQPMALLALDPQNSLELLQLPEDLSAFVLRLHQALAAELAFKNLFIATFTRNMVLLDGLVEERLYAKGQALLEITRAVLMRMQEHLRGPATALCGSNQRDVLCVILDVLGSSDAPQLCAATECRLQAGVDWDVVAPEKAELEALCVSAAGLLSSHASALANEIERAAIHFAVPGAAQAPATAILRKRIGEKRQKLVDARIILIAQDCLHFGTQYQVCRTSHMLRSSIVALWGKSDEGEHPQPFFTLGTHSDSVRGAPRAAVDSGRRSTCLVTRSARIECVRYVPHCVQILRTDYENITGMPIIEGDNPTEADVLNSNCIKSGKWPRMEITTHLRGIVILYFQGAILHYWLALLRLVSSAVAAPLPYNEVLNKPQLCAATTRVELQRVLDAIAPCTSEQDLFGTCALLKEQLSARHLALLNALNACHHSFTRSDLSDNSSLFKIESNSLPGVREPAYSRDLTALFVTRRHEQGPDTSDTCNKNVSLSGSAVALIEKELSNTAAIGSLRYGRDLDAALAAVGSAFSTHAEADWQRGWCAYAFCYANGTNSYFTWGPYTTLHPSRFLAHSDANGRRLFGNCLTQSLCNMRSCGFTLPLSHPILDPSRSITKSAHQPPTLDNTFLTGTTLQTRQMNCVNPLPWDGFVRISELPLLTARRDAIRELYTIVCVESEQAADIEQSLPCGSQLSTDFNVASASGRCTRALEEETASTGCTYAKNIVMRVKTLINTAVKYGSLEEGDFTRGGAAAIFLETELMRNEVNRRLAEKTSEELRAILHHIQHHEQGNMENAAQKVVTRLLCGFLRVLRPAMSKTKEGPGASTVLCIPQQNLQDAFDILTTAVVAWTEDELAELQCVTLGGSKTLAALVVDLFAQCNVLKQQIEGLYSALPRRVDGALADAHYSLLNENAILRRKCAMLSADLENNSAKVYADARNEFAQKISELETSLALRTVKFGVFKHKLFKDMQATMEEVKRSSMFRVSGMQHTPIHVKRQALNVAVADDELSRVTRQNESLREAVSKLKLWYELKLARQQVVHENETTATLERVRAASSSMWADRATAEVELQHLRQSLETVRVDLVRSDREVDALRRELQIQAASERELVAWKAKRQRFVDDLQKKLAEYDKVAGKYDLRTLVSEYERLAREEAERTALKNTNKALADTSPRVISGQELWKTLAQLNARRTLSATVRPVRIWSAGRPRPPSGVKRRPVSAVVGSHSSAEGSSQGPAVVYLEEYIRIFKLLETERRFKEDAFAKVDELRFTTPDSVNSVRREGARAAPATQFAPTSTAGITPHISPSRDNSPEAKNPSFEEYEKFDLS